MSQHLRTVSFQRFAYRTETAPWACVSRTAQRLPLGLVFFVRSIVFNMQTAPPVLLLPSGGQITGATVSVLKEYLSAQGTQPEARALRVGTKNTSPRGSLCAVRKSLKTHSSEMLWQSARVCVDLHVSTWGSFSDLSSWRISPIVEALIPTARRRQHLFYSGRLTSLSLRSCFNQ